MTGDHPVLVGLLLYLLVAATPTLVVWLVLRLMPIASGWAERRRTPPPPPSLEIVVANLRRLRREVRGAPPPSRVRRLALAAAYDDTLLQLCALVGVDAPLADAAEADRAFARLLTEAELERAGIALDPPRGSAAA